MKFRGLYSRVCQQQPWLSSCNLLGPEWVLLLAVCLQAPVSAQVGRYYINTPVDTHMVSSIFTGVRSNTLADTAIGASELVSRNQTLTLSYAYITSLSGRTGGFGFAIPSVSMLSYDDSSGEVLLDESGTGDVALTFDYNLFGAPALPREEFVRYTPDDYSGLHFSLNAPTGDYDPDREVNIGTNRWALKTTLNYSVTGNGGVSWWDFFPSVRLFGDNDDFAGSTTLSQKPLWGLEAHYSRNVTPSAWISVGMVGSLGGEIRVDNVITEESKRSLRLALGAGFATWPRGAAIMTYGHDLIDQGGAARVDSFMLQLLHKF